MLERERRGRGTPVRSSLPGNHNLSSLLRDLNHQTTTPGVSLRASAGPPPQKRQRIEPLSAGMSTSTQPYGAPPVTLKRVVGNALAGRSFTPAGRASIGAKPSYSSSSSGGRGGSCFKCGNAGHWATQCPGSGGSASTGGRGAAIGIGFGRGRGAGSGGRGAGAFPVSGPRPGMAPPSVESLMAKVGPKLSTDQTRGLELALRGQSLFFTGSAGTLPPPKWCANDKHARLIQPIVWFVPGTGKSLLLREMVRLLREMHGDDAVYVTASTGLAACNIGGCTVRISSHLPAGHFFFFFFFFLPRSVAQLHSYAGVGLGEQSQDVLVTKVLSSKRSRERWVTARVLVVDEVVNIMNFRSLFIYLLSFFTNIIYASMCRACWRARSSTSSSMWRVRCASTRRHSEAYSSSSPATSYRCAPSLRSFSFYLSYPACLRSPVVDRRRLLLLCATVAPCPDEKLLLRVRGVEEGGAGGGRPHPRLPPIGQRLRRPPQRSQVPSPSPPPPPSASSFALSQPNLMSTDGRVGKITDEGSRMLARCMIPFKERARGIHSDDDRIQPTLLYPHRRDVDGENGKRLIDLPGESVLLALIANAAKAQTMILSTHATCVCVCVCVCV
jgi:hypothetical protein